MRSEESLNKKESEEFKQFDETMKDTGQMDASDPK
jgi:hypothetical protein